MNLQENINRIKVLMENSSDIYYHGTIDHSFNEEDIKPNDIGLIFFTKHREIAYRYANHMNVKFDYHSEPDYNNSRILSYHLNVKNTFDPEQYSDDPEYIELLANTGDFSSVQRSMFDGDEEFNQYASDALYEADYPVLETKGFIDGLKQRGFDSIYIDNSPYYPSNHKDEIFTGKDIGVFYPELATPVKNKYD
jgi:hypothetical protein